MLVRNLKINARRVQVFAVVRRRRESETFGIDAIAPRRIVGHWISACKEGQKGLVGSYALRVKRRNLARTQEADAGRSSVQTRRSVARQSRCRIRRIVDVRELSASKLRRRNGTIVGNRLGLAQTLIVKEEENLVLFERTSEAATELVTHERSPRNSVSIIEPIVRFQEGVAIVLA